LVKNRQFEHNPPYGASIGSDPVGILQRSLTQESWSPWAIVWRCLRDRAFSCFGTVPACDGWMDTRQQQVQC